MHQWNEEVAWYAMDTGCTAVRRKLFASSNGSIVRHDDDDMPTLSGDTRVSVKVRLVMANNPKENNHRKRKKRKQKRSHVACLLE